MPATWGLPTTTTGWSVEDIEQFNRLPFWMAQQESYHIPYWSRWKDLFAKRKWSPNMGDTLVGVVQEYSPKSQQYMKPTYLTSNPLKTVVSHFQRTNTARLYRHRFESQKFNFLPSFRDFVKGRLKFAADDLNRQIAFGYDDFVRWQVMQLSPACYCVGLADALVQGVPVGPPGEGNLTDPKTTAFFQSMIANIGSDGYLDFRNICAVRSYARNKMGIVPWDGVPDAPKDNAILSGKWVLMGDPAIYEAMTFDSHVLNTRELQQDLQTKEWMGIISGNILFRAERFDMRIAADGTFPAPEIEQENPMPGTITSGSMSVTNPGGAARNVEVVPNPAYVNAPVGVAWWFGHQPYETLDVGPPPEEFASARLNTSRISRLAWNGEITLTDNLLEQYGGASGSSIDNIDTNKYGELLQLISQVTLGIIPVTSRAAFPIFYRRNISPSTNANV